MSQFLRLRALWLLVLVSLLVGALGCLRIRPGQHLLNEWRSNNNSSFSDSPTLPKAEFGRQNSGMAATGSDRRAREIEASLGVGE